LPGTAELAALTIDCLGFLAVTAISAAVAALAALLASLSTIIVRNRYGIVRIDGKTATFPICKIVGVMVGIP
jgi:hypothetical protein